MLDAARPAAEAMTEYVQACRLLGHAAPDPAGLRAAYTAEDGIDLRALDADQHALSEATAAAGEALLLQDSARAQLTTQWQGAGAGAAADRLMRHAEAAATAVDGLRRAAGALDELRNRLWQLMDDKVATTQSIEARGVRIEWLGAARTVTTGAGDRGDASELVDLQVAPFVANDIGVDWMSSMRDTEAAIRQAYRDAATVTDQPSGFPDGREGSFSSAAEQVPGQSASVEPAAYAPAPAPVPVAAQPVPPVDLSAPAPMSPMGGLGGGASPWGSGMSGLSGLGQSLSDILGGLLGTGSAGLGESLDGTEDLGAGLDDAENLGDPEDPDPEDDPEDEDDDEPGEDVEAEDVEGDGESGDETAAPDEEAVIGAPVEQPEEAAPPLAVDPGEPVVPVGEPAPTPETPCEIAADELPQAGP